MSVLYFFSQFIKKHPEALEILVVNINKPLKDIALILYLKGISNKGTTYSLSTISTLISFVKEIKVNI